MPVILFSRAERGLGFCFRKKYSFFRKRWSRRRARLSAGDGDVECRKRGFRFTLSVKMFEAVSGECARAISCCAIWAPLVLGAASEGAMVVVEAP